MLNEGFLCRETTLIIPCNDGIEKTAESNPDDQVVEREYGTGRTSKVFKKFIKLRPVTRRGVFTDCGGGTERSLCAERIAVIILNDF